MLEPLLICSPLHSIVVGSIPQRGSEVDQLSPRSGFHQLKSGTVGGIFVGVDVTVGASVGTSVGVAVGASVGVVVGASVGVAVGTAGRVTIGAAVATTVDASVGAPVDNNGCELVEGTSR